MINVLKCDKILFLYKIFTYKIKMIDFIKIENIFTI